MGFSMMRCNIAHVLPVRNPAVIEVNYNSILNLLSTTTILSTIFDFFDYSENKKNEEEGKKK